MKDTIPPGGKFTIRHTPEGFELIDEAGTVLERNVNPRRLSDWAFARDAESVRHGYDLKLAEAFS